ncbi:hypothetical protein P691DRAFT_781461 [Macrolepiota fuliginosa MF-IS2]|uniref:Uncharacterized protein n=1 Tax=Macrolepiota fuliginosa MF-IS2 TaxID=1400762 RepID=A0A9P5WZW0_9AGAR|nr:hypothetical protein P691DRAFT_781461 [Macrolepiota fuliginosa MF-IS2]
MLRMLRLSCVGVKGPLLLFGGWVVLEGNSDDNAAPKSSFYWEEPDGSDSHLRHDQGEVCVSVVRKIGKILPIHLTKRLSGVMRLSQAGTPIHELSSKRLPQKLLKVVPTANDRGLLNDEERERWICLEEEVKLGNADQEKGDIFETAADELDTATNRGFEDAMWRHICALYDVGWIQMYQAAKPKPKVHFSGSYGSVYNVYYIHIRLWYSAELFQAIPTRNPGLPLVTFICVQSLHMHSFLGATLEAWMDDFLNYHTYFNGVAAAFIYEFESVFKRITILFDVTIKPAGGIENRAMPHKLKKSEEIFSTPVE